MLSTAHDGVESAKLSVTYMAVVTFWDGTLDLGMTRANCWLLTRRVRRT